MAADTLCSRVSKFIFLNKGKITEAFLVKTTASKEPSLPTLLGCMLTAMKAVVLIPVPHCPGRGGQVNFSHRLKTERGADGGLFNRMPKGPGPGGRACNVAYRQEAQGRGKPLTLRGENNHSENQEQF